MEGEDGGLRRPSGVRSGEGWKARWCYHRLLYGPPLGERKGERWLVHDEWESWEGGRGGFWGGVRLLAAAWVKPHPSRAEPSLRTAGKSRIRG